MLQTKIIRWAIIFICIISILLVLSFFNQIYHFSPNFVYIEWANYGMYINGIIAVLLSLFTVILLIINYMEQRSQNFNQNEYYKEQSSYYQKQSSYYEDQKEYNLEQKKYLEKQAFDNEFNNQINQYYKVVDSLKDTGHPHFWSDLKYVDSVKGNPQINPGSFYVKESEMVVFDGRVLYESSKAPSSSKNCCLADFGVGRLFFKNLYLFLKGAQDYYIYHLSEPIEYEDKIKDNFKNHLEIYRPIISHYFATVFRIFKFIQVSENTEENKIKLLNLFLDNISYYELPLIFYYALYMKLELNDSKYFFILKTCNLYKLVWGRVLPKDFFRESDIDLYKVIYK